MNRGDYMRISNNLPVPSMMVPSTGKKTGVPVAQVNNVQQHVSLQKSISAYTVVQEAHQLVTMALNISFELIQKAYSKESSYTEIIAKLATIDSYFNRLSPGTANVPAISPADVVEESSQEITQLQKAVTNNDIKAMNAIHNSLINNSQILDSYKQTLSRALGGTDTDSPDINVIKKIIEDNASNALMVHQPLHHDNVKKLLS